MLTPYAPYTVSHVLYGASSVMFGIAIVGLKYIPSNILPYHGN